jgi:putative ABC transport system permease protein
MPEPFGGRTRSTAWADVLRARLAELRLAPAREAEIVEELSQHLDDRYDELRAAGISDREAHRLALEELSAAGGLGERMKTLAQARTPAIVVHEQPGRHVFRGLWEDVRYALRSMRRQPGFAATIIVTLALGLAANTVVFTIVNAAVLRPLPVRDPARVVRLETLVNADTPDSDAGLSYLDFQDWRASSRTFEDIQASRETAVDVSDGTRPASRVSAAYVSFNTFSLLGQPPALGRDFTESDDRIGARPVVILGGDFWRAQYGADPGIVGRTIRVAGIPSTVVGVMPPGFGFPDSAELWLPVAALPRPDLMSRDARVLEAVGRLRPDATIEQARSDLPSITRSLSERYPDTNRKMVAFVEPYGIAPPIVAVLFALLGTVGCVLMIACANVANLLLARAADRSRDASLRVALGASRWRIVRQLLIESLLLAAAGSVFGLALSFPGIQLFRNLPAESAPPYWIQFTLDGRVFAYLALLCLVSAGVCALVPAWQASKPDLAATLNDAGRTSAGSRSRSRWIGAYVIAQVAVALVLLTGGAMMMRNLISLVRTDVGVETAGIMQMTIDLRRPDDTPERRLMFFSQLDERLASSNLAGFTLASQAPLGGARVQRVRIEGRLASSSDALPAVSVVSAGPRYFEVIGARLISGRALVPADLQQPGDSVVVNERFARSHFPNAHAVGQRVLLQPANAPSAQRPPENSATLRWATIVGVIGNVRQRLLPSGDFDPVLYRPYTADPPQMMRVIARSSAFSPAALRRDTPSESSVAVSFVQQQIRALDPDRPVFAIGTIDQLLAQQIWPQRLFGAMFAGFAMIALLLATCGLYAVTAYAVSRRTREIGVRVALGADARRVWWAVTSTTIRQLAIGVTLGTAGAAGIATILPAFLVGASGTSPLAFAAVIVLLAASGIVASAVPARRATRLDPVAALQGE